MKKMSALMALLCGWGIQAYAGGGGPATRPGSGTLLSPAIQLQFPRLDYEVRVNGEEARLWMDVTAQASGKQEVQQTLLEGEMALVRPKLSPGLRLEREGNCYVLSVSKAGTYHLRLEAAVKVTSAEPWNQIEFEGPAAAIASITAEAAGPGVELQLLSGTTLASATSNGLARVQGFLGSEKKVGVRWSRLGGVGEIARKGVVTAETSVSAQITPTVIKYVTQVRYDILQGKITKLQLALPATHALTRLAGEGIRDWELKPAAGAGAALPEGTQILEVQFVKPLEQQYPLTIYSEQTVEAATAPITVALPEPLEMERETGVLVLSAEDTLAEVESAAGLRQVNAPNGTLAAYHFNGRPISLAMRLRRIEPVISVAERVSARLEETRLVSSHELALDVKRAGVYALDLTLPAGFTVGEVRGEGVEDWKVLKGPGEGAGTLRVNFANRVLGTRNITLQLEQPIKVFPGRVFVGPVRVGGAAKETSEAEVAAAPGLRIKTAELTGIREVPVRMLQSRTNGAAGSADEGLGFKAEQADWGLSLATERLNPRIVAEVFNLVTIGDGIVGGSATIRYGLLNQGVQEFDLAVPAAWRNLEFTGPNIRRKEQRPDGTWAIGLQEKVWGGYTLVVTYDYQYDPKGATVVVGGLHALGVEREAGSVALTTAASLKVNPKLVSEALRPVDELELSAADRSLITRSVLLAYHYDAPQYDLRVEVQRFEEASLLSAVADRTQLTTVLTDAGEMLTQASFMVKNNDKQYQRFRLPADARFWSCHVNGLPVKAERDGDWLMAPLLRGANRNQAFAVDLVYAETNSMRPALLPRALSLQAPQTDVPNTYAEWQLFAPAAFRLSGFAGNMTPVRGTTYDLLDAWHKFTRFYWEFLHEAGPGLFLAITLIGLVVALIASAVRRGASGILSVLVVFSLVAILAAMLLPALARSKARAQRINATNCLKQIGLAAMTWALDNNDRLPNSYEDMMNELSTDKITYDPESGQRFIYVGAGLELSKIQPDSVIAYSPTDNHGRCVLMADGSVQQLSSSRFEELERRGWIVPATPQQVAQNQQLAVVRGAQFQPATVQPLGVSTATPESTESQPAPVGPRVRSIHIEIPHEGQAFAFTKVLHLDNQPLNVRVKLMKLQTFQMLQMILQTAAFLAGVTVWWWQWRGARRSLVLALALALSLCSVGSLLLAWRMLHLAFIWVAPVLLLAVLGWVTWRFWPRSPAPEPSRGGFEPGIPPAVATVAFLLFSLTCSIAAPAEAAGETVIPQSKSNSTWDPSHVSRITYHAPKSSIVSASYKGSVTSDVARIEASMVVDTSEPNLRLFLFGNDVAVEQFASRAADARLEREADGVAVRFGRAGESTLQVRFLVKLGGEISRRQLVFKVPDALTSELALRLDQPDAEVEFPGAISLRRTVTGEQTRIEAMLGVSERVELAWTPRVKRAGEVAANVICHNATLVSFGSGALNARATLDYQVTQGEMRQARIRLPAGHQLLRVEGKTVRTWTVGSENGQQVVQVELLKGESAAVQLTVETEKMLETLPAVVKVEIPHALGVKRETGLLAVRGDEELELAIDNTEELYRVDSEEFARVAERAPSSGAPVADGQTPERRLPAGPLNAFRFLKPEFALQVRLAPMQPQIEAVAHHRLVISQEQANLLSTIDYTIKRAGVFGLELALPAGYRLDGVSGVNILQNVERNEAGQRVLALTLKERTSGAYALRLELTRTYQQLPKSLDIEGPRPLGTEKLAGFVLVSAEPGVAVKAQSFDGLTEVPAATLGASEVSSAGSSLAYKFITAQPQATAGWALKVQTETIESWVRAEIVNTLTLSDALVSGQARVRFEIQNAPVNELRLKIPAAFKNVEITGPNIRRRDQDGETWLVELQSKVRGAQTLTVTWEQAREARTNAVELRGIGVVQVERETGVLAVVARPPLQVTERAASELKPIDLRDLPDWAGAPEEATVLAYRYARPGYRLEVEARRYAQAEVLQALVEDLRLSTVVADDGQMMTEMTLAVKNQGRQHLEIALPDGAKVWSAFVAGQPVRPSKQEGKLLLPLEHSVGDESAIPISLVYVDSCPFPQGRGALELVSPTLDAPLKSARWELFLPPDYAYSEFGGTMTHETETALLEPSSFSFLDYSSRESLSKAELAKELKSDISNAQRKLSSGNVKEALADYNRARSKGDLAATNTEARELEAGLRRAQGNNLIEAQNAFSVSNDRALNGESQAPSGTPAMQYDTAAAEAQWAKLQQAQDLGVSRVQPIRVNLPTRGLRHGFNQVLQTEAGRPLKVRLLAANGRTVSWPKRLGAAGASFLLLWSAVAFITRRSEAHRHSLPA